MAKQLTKKLIGFITIGLLYITACCYFGSQRGCKTLGGYILSPFTAFFEYLNSTEGGAKIPPEKKETPTGKERIAGKQKIKKTHSEPEKGVQIIVNKLLPPKKDAPKNRISFNVVATVAGAAALTALAVYLITHRNSKNLEKNAATTALLAKTRRWKKAFAK